jgi:hypothetical protein
MASIAPPRVGLFCRAGAAHDHVGNGLRPTARRIAASIEAWAPFGGKDRTAAVAAGTVARAGSSSFGACRKGARLHIRSSPPNGAVSAPPHSHSIVSRHHNTLILFMKNPGIRAFPDAPSVKKFGYWFHWVNPVIVENLLPHPIADSRPFCTGLARRSAQ